MVTLNRRDTSGLAHGAIALISHSLNFDASNRLSVVSDGVNNVTHSYLAARPLVEQIPFR